MADGGFLNRDGQGYCFSIAQSQHSKHIADTYYTDNRIGINHRVLTQ